MVEEDKRIDRVLGMLRVKLFSDIAETKDGKQRFVAALAHILCMNMSLS